MAGIYLHIPFCKSRCIYCSFYSTTLTTLRQRYTDALCKEMAYRRAELKEPVSTIYLGGGTPSQLTTSQLTQLFDQLEQLFHLSSSAGENKALEITIECNPDDVDGEMAAALRRLPINRVSMGAQTFDDQRLKAIRRRHNARQIVEAVDRLRQAGIDNISIDLMYGFPQETMDDWLYDINEALALNVEHLSAYCLTYEEGTPLFELQQQGKVGEVGEELSRSMYETLIERLTANGYEHYEISNFARKGKRSRHNSSYWTDVPYLGLGAAAHSYDRRFRKWNVADLHQYIAGAEGGHIPTEEETIGETTHYNDTVMLRLRTREGLDLTSLPRQFRSYCRKQAGRFIDAGLLQLTPDHRLVLSRRGLFVSNMIMSELMMV